MNQDLLQELFDYRDGCLYWRVKKSGRIQIGDRFGSYEKNGYRRGMLNYKHRLEHRLIWLWHGLDLPKGMEIDHINHSRSDNRIDNLRLATRELNARNLHKDNSTRVYPGVKQAPSGRYVAEFHLSAGYIYLGTFDTVEEAIKARKEKEVELNFHPNHIS